MFIAGRDNTNTLKPQRREDEGAREGLAFSLQRSVHVYRIRDMQIS